MIFLIGMPGAGKTHFAKLLSGQCNYDYVDLDDFIEQKEGKSIMEMFATKGEDYFREIEAACLKDVINNCVENKTIIACGGGTPAYANNVSVMKEHGCVVYLKADIATLVERVRINKGKRPMLTSAMDLEATLNELYTIRAPFYEQADYTINTNEITLVNFDKIIRICTGRQ